MPLELICQQDKYKLQVIGNFGICVGNKYIEKWELDLKSKVKNNYFQIKDAQNLRICSVCTTHRRIGLLKSQNRIQAFGKTKAV